MLTAILLCISMPHELTDLDRLYLLTKRLTISQYLDDKPMIYQDSNEIYELLHSDPDLAIQWEKSIK